MATESQIETFIQAYLTCAIWSSTDADDIALDRNFSIEDINEESLKDAKDECKEFIALNDVIFDTYGDYSQHGHDFWLTRNHHGAGYWDRGYPSKVGDILTRKSHEYGETDLYVGDDGSLYFS